jgi:hypothetical protein
VSGVVVESPTINQARRLGWLCFSTTILFERSECAIVYHDLTLSKFCFVICVIFVYCAYVSSQLYVIYCICACVPCSLFPKALARAVCQCCLSVLFVRQHACVCVCVRVYALCLYAYMPSICDLVWCMCMTMFSPC